METKETTTELDRGIGKRKYASPSGRVVVVVNYDRTREYFNAHIEVNGCHAGLWHMARTAQKALDWAIAEAEFNFPSYI